MSDPWNKAARYRELAVERERLADLAVDDKVRAYYRSIAQQYFALAEAEMKPGLSTRSLSQPDGHRRD
jgi:hypothetical protein